MKMSDHFISDLSESLGSWRQKLWIWCVCIFTPAQASESTKVISSFAPLQTHRFQNPLTLHVTHGYLAPETITLQIPGKRTVALPN